MNVLRDISVPTKSPESRPVPQLWAEVANSVTSAALFQDPTIEQPDNTAP